MAERKTEFILKVSGYLSHSEPQDMWLGYRWASEARGQDLNAPREREDYLRVFEGKNKESSGT